MSKLTLEHGKKLCKNLVALNGETILIGEIAPSVSSTGIVKTEKDHKEAQRDINQQGLLLVQSTNDDVNYKEGDRIMIKRGHEPSYYKTIETKELLDDLPDNLKEDYKAKKGRFHNMRENELALYHKHYTLFVYHPMSFAARLVNHE